VKSPWISFKNHKPFCYSERKRKAPGEIWSIFCYFWPVVTWFFDFLETANLSSFSTIHTTREGTVIQCFTVTPNFTQIGQARVGRIERIGWKIIESMNRNKRYEGHRTVCTIKAIYNNEYSLKSAQKCNTLS